MGYEAANPTFAGGEIGPELEARFDVDKYKTALRRARNVLLRSAGGAYNRPGMEFVAGSACGDTGKHRIIPFQFSDTQSFILDFGDQFMRVIYHGGLVLETALNIVSITLTNPVVVGITGHPYATGDQVYFSGVLGTTEINDRAYCITKIDANHFSLAADGSAWTAFTGSGAGGVDAVDAPTPTPVPDAPVAGEPAAAPAPTPPYTPPGHTAPHPGTYPPNVN